MKSKMLPIILLLMLSLPSIFSLFQSGFFKTDDGEWMIIRFSAFYQSLGDGQIPVRWLGRLNHEYGYPVSNFLYPGFMYLGVPIKLLGFGFVDTIKIILGISMIGSAVFSYLWLRRFFGAFAAIIGSLVYLYTPYHLYDLYVRGSVGEILALTTVPFILWQIERKSLFWGSIGVGLLILSHNTLAFIFLPAIVFYILLDIYISSKNKKSLIYKYISLLAGGVGLAAFFWIPGIYDLRYTVFSHTAISKWQNYFVVFDLIDYAIFSIFLFTVFIFVTKKVSISNHRLVIFFLLIGMISTYFASQESWVLWKMLPVSVIQFPFRFLSITILSIAFLTAFVLSNLSKKSGIILSALILIVIFLSLKQYTMPVEHFDKGEGFYATNMATTTVQDEYMPKWVIEKPNSRPESKVIAGHAKISDLIVKTNDLRFTAFADQRESIIINSIYFPGWRATIDGYEVPINYQNNKGTIYIPVSEGKHDVRSYFSETPVRLLSDIISLSSLIILSLIFIFDNKKFFTRVAGRL